MAKYKHSENFIKKQEINQLFGKDPTLLADFTNFLDKKVGKVDSSELAKHGGPLSNIYGFIAEHIGQYNPDEISIDTYNKMRMNAQIAAGLKVIKLPIIGQQWTTVCDDKDIAEFIDQLLRPLWYNLLTSTLSAVDFGFAAHEIVYDIEDISLNRKYENKPFYNGKAVVWKKFKSLYPDTVTIKLDEKENFNGIVQKWVGKDVILPVEKSFIFTHDKGDSFGNLFGVSRMKPAYDVWFFWINLCQFMMRYFERKGTPPTIIGFPLWQTKDGTDHADIALEIGKALQGESVVAVPSTTYENTPKKWTVDYLLDDKRGEMFISALTFFENKILRAMFVPERTITQDSSSKAGSYSLSQTHADMFLLGEEALLVDIENQVNKYVIRRLVEYNFGAKAPECYIKIERITEARKGFLKDVFMEMIKNGSAIPAAREIADVVGVPLDDDGNPNTTNDDGQGNLDGSNKNKKGSVKGNKPVKKEGTDNKKFGEITWWREPNKFEDPKMFSEIEEKSNKIEKEYLDNLVNEIWIKQREQVINKIIKMLSDKGSVEDIWYKKVIDQNDTETVTLWRPLNTKILGIFSSLMKEGYLFGQATAIQELGIEDKPILDKEGKSFIQDRTRVITDQYFSNMKYKTEIALLSASSELKEQAIINDVKAQFDTIKDKNLVDIVNSEWMLFLNKGRAKISKEFI